MAQCSFGRVVTNGTWDARYSFGTDLDGRFLYLRDGERQWLLAVFDFSYMFRRTSREWRQAMSGATGIPIGNIWVHELQNHTAPVAPELDGKPCENLVNISLPVIQKMIADAEETELSYVIVDLGERYNLNREQYISGLGMVTVWGGLEFDNDDRAYSQDPSIMILKGWKPDIPAFKKRIYFDRPADPQGALLVFRKSHGDILGGLARFSAHADVAGGCIRDGKDYKYNFDWPGYVRKAIESEMGGTCVCVCGPCGNLSTKKRLIPGYENGDRQAREIGSAIANELVWLTLPFV